MVIHALKKIHLCHSLRLETTNSDVYAEFRTHSDCHVKTVERDACPFDNSEHFSFVECFSFEEVPNSLEEVKRSQPRDEKV